MIDKKSLYPPWQGHRLEQDSNISKLRTLKSNLDGLFDHVLSELDPYIRVLQSISFDSEKVCCGGREIPLKDESSLIVVGAGKASHQMAKALYEIFGDRVSGLVNTHKDLAFEDAYKILTKLQQKTDILGKDIPPSVIDYIKNNRGVAERETLKKAPQNVVNLIVAGNNTAIDFTAERLKSMEFDVLEIHRIPNLSGDIEDAAIEIYSHLLKAVNAHPGKPAAVIAGGEATVDVTRYPYFKDGQSYGGRMQMMAALMLYLIEDLPVVGLFAATDCRDGKPPGGMPESAGALIGGTTLRESRIREVDTERYINACNTYEMHKKLSTQLHKERFVTNVMDLVVLVYLPMD